MVEKAYMNIAVAAIKWACKTTPKYYSEKPDVDLNRVQIDFVVQKFSKGKFGFAGARPVEHICKVCRQRFYTERKHEDVCKKWNCYKSYYCGGK